MITKRKWYLEETGPSGSPELQPFCATPIPRINHYSKVARRCFTPNADLYTQGRRTLVLLSGGLRGVLTGLQPGGPTFGGPDPKSEKSIHCKRHHRQLELISRPSVLTH